MLDSLGDRMKSNYEVRTQQHLTRRTYTIIRIDGKAFHTYTKGLKRPFDHELMSDMDATTAYLCEHIQGAKFGYVQSDEISILLTDFDKLESQAWFDYNVQKMTSISASIATAKFNQIRFEGLGCTAVKHNEWDFVPDLQSAKLAYFDARVFQLPTQAEVANYFIWRQQDAVRNSIQAAAQSMYSPKELHGKNTDMLQELLWQKGINWNDYSSREKRGGFVEKITYNVANQSDSSLIVPRSKWETVECPIFTQDRDFLLSRIPVNV